MISLGLLFPLMALVGSEGADSIQGLGIPGYLRCSAGLRCTAQSRSRSHSHPMLSVRRTHFESVHYEF